MSNDTYYGLYFYACLPYTQALSVTSRHVKHGYFYSMYKDYMQYACLFYAFEIFNNNVNGNQLLRMRIKMYVYAHIPGMLPLKLKFAEEAA